ncbi:MAG: ribonuclease H-like YkuK family protein [Acidobacteriaceae bacterium]
MKEVYISPTKGPLTFEAMFEDLVQYLNQAPGEAHKLIIGTDSQTRDDLCFVSAIIVHRVGKGARYYYRRRHQRKIPSLRQKILYETSLSLVLAGRIAQHLSDSGLSNLDLEIHLDVGQKGDTKDLIREVIGMVAGSGFDAKIKPNSYGASKVADKYTK